MREQKEKADDKTFLEKENLDLMQENKELRNHIDQLREKTREVSFDNDELQFPIKRRRSGESTIYIYFLKILTRDLIYSLQL